MCSNGSNKVQILLSKSFDSTRLALWTSLNTSEWFALVSKSPLSSGVTSSSNNSSIHRQKSDVVGNTLICFLSKKHKIKLTAVEQCCTGVKGFGAPYWNKQDSVHSCVFFSVYWPKSKNWVFLTLERACSEALQVSTYCSLDLWHSSASHPYSE